MHAQQCIHSNKNHEWALLFRSSRFESFLSIFLCTLAHSAATTISFSHLTLIRSEELKGTTPTQTIPSQKVSRRQTQVPTSGSARQQPNITILHRYRSNVLSSTKPATTG
jgi:hypothetical protein